MGSRGQSEHRLNKFSFPKSLYNVIDCIHAVVGDDRNAVVFDYHAGSGTTAHAVLELNKADNGSRRFIMVEQMDYIETITAPRVQKVIENGNLSDSFTYLELKKYNQTFIEQIQMSKSCCLGPGFLVDDAEVHQRRWETNKNCASFVQCVDRSAAS